MKICLVHNAYGEVSGEEIAVSALQRNLSRHGDVVATYFRSSAELRNCALGKAKAFVTGIYNPIARRDFARFLDRAKPDIVHINNLYPLLSPSILAEAKARNIPVVMTLHNYRLLCPTGLLFSRGDICHRCVDSGEWRCATRNCTGEWPKSVGYALRAWVSRLRGAFFNHVDRFVALSEFAKSLFVRNGLDAERIDVAPNFIDIPDCPSERDAGEYVGYLGRISHEKGIDVLLEAARQNPDIPFRLAGHHLQMPNIRKVAPANCEILGAIPPRAVARFLRSARFVVLSSRCYEGAPVSVVEAMLQRKPAICSRIGALPELVKEDRTGLLFERGDSSELAGKVRFLWQRPALCREMGDAARTTMLAMFSPEAIYARLMNIYRSAQSQAIARAAYSH